MQSQGLSYGRPIKGSFWTYHKGVQMVSTWSITFFIISASKFEGENPWNKKKITCKQDTKSFLKITSLFVLLQDHSLSFSYNMYFFHLIRNVASKVCSKQTSNYTNNGKFTIFKGMNLRSNRPFQNLDVPKITNLTYLHICDVSSNH